jgi:hypothetical protein
MLPKQRDELGGSLERIRDHREVVRGYGDLKLTLHLGEHERRARNGRAVQRGEPHNRQLVVGGRGSDGDYWGVERGHVMKIRAAEV